MRLCEPVRSVFRGVFLLAVALCFASCGFAAEGAQWIWSAEHARNGVPQTACHFRKSFTIPSARQGKLFIAADDRYELFLNGRRIGSGESPEKLDQYDVSRFLTRGRNLIAVRVTNVEGSTAALAVRIEIEDLTGNEHQYATDTSWVTNLGPLPFWYTPLYNDARWDEAQAFGALGSTPPWDDVSPALAERGSATTVRDESPDGLVSESRLSDQTMQIADTPVEVQEDGAFHVGPEFKVEALLDNETTGSLIAMTFNEFGHIIASREGGELLLIHDGDGDQEPDNVRVYSDLVKDCHGILCLNGFVFVTGLGPDGRGLYRLRDNDRDGRLEEVETLLAFPAGESEYGPHGLTLGSDGYLYVVVGNQAGVPEAVDASSPYHGDYEGDLVSPRQEAPDQQHAGAPAPGGTVMRLDVNGKKVQILAGGLRNAYDLAFNREGELFTHDSDMEADLGTPWYRPTTLHHVIAGAEFGWRSGWAKWPEYYVDRVPGILDTGRGAPTGMVFYQHYIFPEEYQDALFVADWSNGQIVVVKLKSNGATYAASSEVFLEGDSLSISDLDVGPDGSLYFVSGGRGTVGGLYRVKWKGTPSKAATELGTGLNAVIRQPQLDSAWSRQKIAALKTELGAQWDQLVPGVAMSSANPWQYRIRALNLMQLYGPAPTAESLVKLSQVKNEIVRCKAAELMGIHSNADTEKALLQLLADTDRRVRRSACEALQRAGQDPPLETLLPLLKSDDRAEAWAARRLLENCPVDQWRDELLGSNDPRLLIQGSLALLIAHPNRQHAELVLEKISAAMKGFVTDRDFVDMLRVMQVALLQGDIPPADVPAIREMLVAEFPAGDASMNRELIRLLAYLQAPGLLERSLTYLESEKVPQVEKLHLAMHLRHLPDDWTPEQRMQVLEFFDRARRQESAAGYTAYVSEGTRQFAQDMSEEEIRLALDYGDRWPRGALSLLYRMPETLDADTLQTLKQLDRKILDSNEPDVLRLKVGIVAVLARSGDGESLSYLRDLWDRDPERRMAVAMGLAQWPNEESWHYLVRSLPVLDGGAAREVLAKLRSIRLAPEEPEFYRHVILRGMELGDEGGAEAVQLLEFWTGKKLGDDQDPNAALAAWQQWYAEKWPELPEAKLPEYSVRGKWNYKELVKYLTLGDGRFGSIERGSEVFQRVHCAKCHRFGDIGEEEGPDLTALSRRAMKKEILESILFPSHLLPPTYATHTVVTTREQKFSGHIVRQQGSDRLLLVQLDNRVVTLDQADVEEILPEKVSLMPEGLLDELNLQEISDLFAYLCGVSHERLVESPENSVLR